MSKGSTAVRGALLCLLLVPAAAEAEGFTIITPPGGPTRFYAVPWDIVRPNEANPRYVRQKLQVPRSRWGPRGPTATPTVRRGQWYIFPVCGRGNLVTPPGKLVDPTDVRATLRCP